MLGQKISYSPNANATTCEKDDNNIPGPTRPKTLPICSGILSLGKALSFCSTSMKINKLSTPTASTRNGITSIIIRVTSTFAYENTPIAETTDNSTIITPDTPTVI